MEYYKLELDRSMNEAQLTGIYFSPEQKDMLGQLRAAEDTYNNLTVSTEDKDRAGKIINSIENWFSTNGLSKAGIRTLAKLDSDRNDLMVKQSTILAAIETIPSGAYALKDNKGNYIMSADGLTVQYFMPSIASASDKFNYFSGNYTIDGKTVDTGKQVFVQELNKLNNQTLNTWYGNLSQADKDKSAIELTAMLSTYMGSASNPLHNFAKGIVSENGTGLNYQDILGGTGKYKDGFYQTEYTVAGKTFAVDYNLNTGEVKVSKPGQAPGTSTVGIDVTTFNIKDVNGNAVQSITPANTFALFASTNTVPLYLGTKRITERTELNKDGFNASSRLQNADGSAVRTAEQIISQGYTKLFTEAFDNGTFDYYGKPLSGTLNLVRIKK
jgi:hypothetical protein